MIRIEKARQAGVPSSFNNVGRRDMLEIQAITLTIRPMSEMAI
jgi:hypothetical protein